MVNYNITVSVIISRFAASDGFKGCKQQIEYKK